MLFGSNSLSFNPNFAFLREDTPILVKTKIKRPINISAIDHIYQRSFEKNRLITSY